MARLVGVPRPTAYRLLETLEGMGFVVRGPSGEEWRPTLHTKSLSSGFRDEDWVAQIAVPEMMRLGRRILWPLDLVTFRDYRMAVRESTHNISPFSIDLGMVGRELPVLKTSGGRAYLANIAPEEREQILARLRTEYGEGAVDHHEDGPLPFILNRTRELGLGYRSGGFNDHTMSLSAPIMAPERPIACLTVIWIASAMKMEEAIHRHGGELKETAGTISRELARLAAENAEADDRAEAASESPPPAADPNAPGEDPAR
ncbi:IclR family mhp operon transcriptional activator [Amorphus suaedae]